MAEESFVGYLKFSGPLANDGSLDIEKVGKSLLAFNRMFQRYQKDIIGIAREDGYILKIADVKKGSTEIDLIIESIKTVVTTHGAQFALFAHGLDKIGVTEFSKEFFRTAGQQFSLKIFSGGKNLHEIEKKIVGDKVVSVIENYKKERVEIPVKEWENHEVLKPYLDETLQLEKGKEEAMSIGYRENGKAIDLVRMSLQDKQDFSEPTSLSLEERIQEPFDESKAQEIKMIGVFVDFYGLAHKYHFSFQARREQEKIGKQKILCIVSPDKISGIIDYLKPENNQNVCISGMATKDWEGRIDKIKIDWVSRNPDYNPGQRKIV